MTYSAKSYFFLLLTAAVLISGYACGGSGGNGDPDGDQNLCEPGLDFDEGMQACVCVADGCCYEDSDCAAGQVCNSAHRCLGDIPDDDYIPADEDGDAEDSDSGEGEGEGEGDGDYEGDGDKDQNDTDDADGDVTDGDEELGTQLQPYYGVEALTAFERMPEFLPLASSAQFSSSDPSGANFDHLGNNLYMEGSRQIIFDSKRPGCIYRMQFNRDLSGNVPAIALQFFFDDEESERINSTIELMFDGDNAPFLAPLVGKTYLIGSTPQSYYSYVPICWQQRLKIAASGPLAGYNIQYHNFASDIGIEGYNASINLSDAIDYYSSNLGEDPKPDHGAATHVITDSYPVTAGSQRTLTTISQAGAIDSLRIRPTPNEDEDIMTNARLQITWDNKSQPDVDVPLGMFFGRGFYDTPGNFTWHSLPVGMDDDGWMYCYFPMPFFKHASIKVINNSSTNITSLDYEITWTENEYPRGVGIFSAVFNESKPISAGRDFVALSAYGRGKYVGTVLAMEPTDYDYTRNFLYGDERIYIDEMSSPAIMGTGTAEFFNGGERFGGEIYETPLFSVWKDDNNYQYMARRFQLSDTIPFNYSIKVGFEHGGSNDVDANYKSVSYFYLSCLGGMTLSDSIKIYDTMDEQAHDFSSAGTTTVPNRTYAYMGDNSTTSFKVGRAITQSGSNPGYFLFTIGASETRRLNPKNIGVRLKRTLDWSVSGQDARVYVINGEEQTYVGNWYTPGRNTNNYWLDSVFDIPGEFTSGKQSLTVKIEYAGGNNWNMYGELFAYSFLPLQSDSSGPGPVPLAGMSYEMYGMQPRLSWAPPTEGTPAAIYHIYRVSHPLEEPSDNTLLGSTSERTFLDPDTLLPNTTYYYRFVAEDCTGVRGQASVAFEVQTGQPSLCIDFKLNNVLDDPTTTSYSLESYVGYGFDSDDVIYLAAPSDAHSLFLQATAEQALDVTASYHVVVTFLKAPNFGKWQLSVNSSVVGDIQDGYAAINEAGEVDLGTMNITAGQPVFRFRVKPKNESSIGYALAIDKICLK